MNIKLQTLNANGEVVNAAVSLNAGAQPAIVRAESGQRFQLIDEQTGFAPENIEVKRVGDDLHIAFEGQTIDQPGLVIQDYYNTAGDGTDNLVVGMHENGQIYPYIPETAQSSEAIHQLAESVSANQALGGSVTYGAAMPPLWPLVGLGLLGVGGIAALAGGGGSDGDDSPAAPAATLSGPEAVNESVGTVNYTVTLDKPATADTTFTYTITPNAPTGADDFNGPLTGTVTIPQGQNSAVIPVPINNDSPYEGPETYTVTLSDPKNATIGNSSVTTTIWDNGTTDGSTPADPANPNNPGSVYDDRPTVSITGAASVNEGIGAVEYTVSLDKPSAVDTVVTLTVAHGNTNDADFGARGTRTEKVTIPAGQTSAKVYVDIANDDVYESANGPEQYSVSIADPVNAKLGNASVTTQIWDNGTTDGTTPGSTPPDPNHPNTPFDTDDDRPYVLSIDGAANVNEAVGTVQYTISLNQANTQAIQVDVIVANGSTEDADFGARGVRTETITIPAGQTTAVVNVDIANDSLYEIRENYTVSLANPVNAAIGKGSVTTTIWDNGTTDGSTPADPANPNNPGAAYDDRPTVSISGAPSVNEGAGAVEYTVSLDKPSAVDTTVTLTVAHGNTDDADFGTRGARTETVTIPAGQTSAKVYVDIANDDVYESANGPEQYSVSIADPVNAKLGNASVTTQIWDNGTTDGTTPGSTPPDPNNPNAPFDTDDDRERTFDPGKKLEVIEGDSKPAEGIFKIGPMEFVKLTIDGKDIGLNALINASKEYPHTVEVGGGQAYINITGYDKNSGEVSYTYRSDAQKHPQDTNSLPDSIKVVAHNLNGQTVIGTLTFSIKDTVWHAADDSASVKQDESVNGDLLANDTKGADALNNIAIAKGDLSSANGSISNPINGEYGQLSVKTDGTYTYEANNAKQLGEGESATDTFTYTLTDADGDSTTAKLEITVEGKNDAPVAQDGQSSVTENSVNTQVIQTNASDPDANDSISAYEITAISSSGYTANGISVSFSFSKNPDGSWTITNEASAQKGNISIDNDGKISIDETGSNLAGRSVFDTLPEGTKLDLAIQYQATDSHGEKSNIATHTVTVQGIDDAAELDSPKALIELTRRTSQTYDVNLNDADTGEGYLAKVNNPNTRLAIGDSIEGRYGTFTVTNIQEANSIYDVKYQVDTSNIAVRALGNDGFPTILHDYLNVTSYGNGKLIIEDEHGSAYIRNTAATSRNIAIKSAAQLATDSEDAYYIDGDLATALDTKAANDAVYVKGNVSAQVDLGDGDDYFYAEGNVSGTINGGDGDDTFTLFDMKNNGTINGGAGKDTLILAKDNVIGTESDQLKISGIEVIDTRQGEAGSTVTADKSNTVTITEDALLANGTDISIFAGTGDTINLDVADTASVTKNGNVYTYNGNNGTYTITDELNIGINIV